MIRHDGIKKRHISIREPDRKKEVFGQHSPSQREKASDRKGGCISVRR